VINCVVVLAKQPQKRKDHVADVLPHLKTVSGRKTFVDIFFIIVIPTCCKAHFSYITQHTEVSRRLNKATARVDTFIIIIIIIIIFKSQLSIFTHYTDVSRK
jgi:predicted Na+-dependent transporter